MDPVVPPSTIFAKALCDIANEQNSIYDGQNETDPCHDGFPCLARQIAVYWNELHAAHPQVPGFDSVATYWSAAFISWCVFKAAQSLGHPVGFQYSESHSKFVHHAIHQGGAFQGQPITSYAPRVGDIVANNRSGNHFDFAYASAHDSYESHSRIVVEKGMDAGGKFVRLIGGNENATGTGAVHISRHALNSDGTLVQGHNDVFIAILQNLL